jgi:peptidoglycan/LPS O-acetylase OafA/YrhL
MKCGFYKAMTRKPSEKVDGIQIARALAALSIVYFHSWVALQHYSTGVHTISVLQKYGHYSINLFFAISGYVICFVLSKPTFDLKGFAIKRALRLYPLYWLCLAVFAYTVYIRGPSPKETTEYILYSATLLPTHDMPYYDVAWSLQHEIFFYFMAALIVPRFGLKVLVAVLACSAALATYLNLPVHSLPISHFHLDFMMGVLAYMLRNSAKKYDARIFSAIGLAFMFFGFWLPVELSFPLAWFFLLYGLSAFDASRAPWLRPLVTLGDASYSLYMIHAIVFLFAYRYIYGLPGWTAEPVRFLLIAACVILSMISLVSIERPFIKLGNHLAKRRSTPIAPPSGQATPLP